MYVLSTAAHQVLCVDSDRPESFPEEITVCWRDMDNGLNDCTIIVMISVRKGNKRALEKQLTEGPRGSQICGEHKRPGSASPVSGI